MNGILFQLFFGTVLVAAAAGCALVGGGFGIFAGSGAALYCIGAALYKFLNLFWSAGGSQSMEPLVRTIPPSTSAPFTIHPELAEWVGSECGISIGVNEIFGALSALGVSSKADLRYITDAMLFWKAYLSIKQPLTAHDPIHPQVTSRPDP